jgi:hypothetical protein
MHIKDSRFRFASRVANFGSHHTNSDSTRNQAGLAAPDSGQRERRDAEERLGGWGMPGREQRRRACDAYDRENDPTTIGFELTSEYLAI